MYHPVTVVVGGIYLTKGGWIVHITRRSDIPNYEDKFEGRLTSDCGIWTSDTHWYWDEDGGFPIAGGKVEKLCLLKKLN